MNELLLVALQVALREVSHVPLLACEDLEASEAMALQQPSQELKVNVPHEQAHVQQ